MNTCSWSLQKHTHTQTNKPKQSPVSYLCRTWCSKTLVPPLTRYCWLMQQTASCSTKWTKRWENFQPAKRMSTFLGATDANDADPGFKTQVVLQKAVPPYHPNQWTTPRKITIWYASPCWYTYTLLIATSDSYRWPVVWKELLDLGMQTRSNQPSTFNSVLCLLNCSYTSAYQPINIEKIDLALLPTGGSTIYSLCSY